MKFTDILIRNLKPNETRYEVREGKAYGNGTLALRVSPNGFKSWQYLYRFGAESTMRRHTLGAYPAMTVAEAHAAAGAAMKKRELGIDPGAQTVELHKAERVAPTVAELAAQYLELYARPRKRSADRDEELLKRNVLPAWGAHKASAITKGDAARLLDAIVARGAPIPANRTRSVLSKMFRWALSRELVERNPIDGLPAPAQETKRNRHLDDAELRAVVSRMETANMLPSIRFALRLQFLTAARIGEAAGAMWSEMDEKAAIWTIPAERCKNKRQHRLPLSAPALAVLSEARALDRGTGAVFPMLQSGGPLKGDACAHAIQANLAHFGVKPFTPHDIRRTVATGLAKARAGRVVVSMVLNHIDPTMTGIYDQHDYVEEMREALDAWGAKIAAIEAAAREPDCTSA